MAGFTIEGHVDIQIDGLEEFVAEARAATISGLQGEVRALANQILRESVARDNAMRSGGTSYAPTHELTDAIVIEGGGSELLIYMDGSRMSMRAPVRGQDGTASWGIHMGVQGQAFNTEMPEYLNYGGGGIIPHSGSSYFEQAWALLENQTAPRLAAAIRAAGFDVSVG